MWIIENNTSFQAERSFTRDKNGAEVWIVVVKGTFNILPDGSTELAEKQEPICLQPEFFGEPGESSLKYESDLILRKPGTDIILHGHAYAPPNKKMESTDVFVGVGSVRKNLHVTGDRYWKMGLLGWTKTPIKPFVKVPLVYERAFGGKDDENKKHNIEPRNPVGTGYTKRYVNPLNRRLPNIWLPKSAGAKRSKTPAGFGPIVSSWAPRSSYAGTYDDNWRKTRKPLLPMDFDYRFFQCAPSDQQVPDYLKGGEDVILNNLTKQGKLRFRLPKIQFEFKTIFGQTFIEHQANLYTILLEPDVPRIIMVWHTSLGCHNKEHLIEGTLITCNTSVF